MHDAGCHDPTTDGGLREVLASLRNGYVARGIDPDDAVELGRHFAVTMRLPLRADTAVPLMRLAAMLQAVLHAAGAEDGPPPDLVDRVSADLGGFILAQAVEADW